MPKSVTISKANSPLPDYLDFKRLKQEGITYIEELAGKNWTDYNLHDPGITIMEVLCYALMDVGYRLNLPIEDLLVPKPEDRKNRENRENNFFTPSEILTNNPLTITDYRRLLMDIKGVKNVWLKVVEKRKSDDSSEAEKEYPIRSRQPIYLHCQEDKPVLSYLDEENAAELHEVKLRGLYRVYLELEENFAWNDCGQPLIDRGKVLSDVRQRLHEHRNLCEDFEDFVLLGEEGIGTCAEIELSSSAKPVEVMVKILEALHDLLSPQIQHYTLPQLLDKGKAIEDVFEGRPHSMDSHGFIDVDELERIEKREVLHTSDFYNVLIDIEGIVAIKRLEIASFIDNVRQTTWQKWCLRLSDSYSPVLDIENSRISFFKGVFPVSLRSDERILATRKFEEIKAATRKGKLDAYNLDLAVPYGQFRLLHDYYSIQNEFPLTYGIGEDGLPSTASNEVKIKAKQLKGYLTLFDQVLANYLGSVANLRDVFALFDPVKPHTYFSQQLEEKNTPKVTELLFNYADENDPSYSSELENITENSEEFVERRERFLDHLLARFSEDFTDYETLVTSLDGIKAEPSQMNADKENFLKNYPTTSRNRGIGYNYLLPDLGTNAGFLERTADLLALKGCGDHTSQLNHFKVVKECEKHYFEIRNCEEVWLKSCEGFESEEEAKLAFDRLCHHLFEEDHYALSECFPFTFWFENKKGKKIASHPHSYNTADERDFALEKLLVFLKTGIPFQLDKIEGLFHFELQNSEGETVLKSIKGYETEEEAKQVLCLALALGRDIANYSGKPCEETPFGFGLVHGEDAVAVHPSCYETEEAKDQAIQKLHHFIRLRGLDGEVRVMEGYFLAVIKRGDQTLLTNIHQFATQEEAQAVCEQLLELAKVGENYFLLHDEKSCEYGFYLTDGEGEKIAEHKGVYESEEERTTAIEAIVAYLTETENAPCEAVEITDTYHFLLKDEYGNVLLESKGEYASEEEANLALEKVAKLVVCRGNFKLAFDDTSCKFGFILTDKQGKTLAKHPVFFADEEYAETKLQQVFEYLKRDYLLVNISDPSLNYYFFLKDKEGNNLLSSNKSYASEQEALAAFCLLEEIGKKLASYRKTAFSDSFSYELVDEEGQVLATPRLAFPTEEKRDKAIEYILVFLLTKGVSHELSSKKGKWGFSVLGKKEQPLLESEKGYEEKMEALEMLSMLIKQGEEPANYRLTGDEKSCEYSFAVLGEEGEVLANATKIFSEPAERDRWKDKVIEYLNSFEIESEIVVSDGLYQYQILDDDCNTALTSEEIFKSKRQALWAFEEAMSLAANRDNYLYKGKKGNYGFALCDYAGQVIASHPETYKTIKAQKEVVSECQYQFDGAEVEPKFAPEKPGYRFGLFDDEKNLLIKSRQQFEVAESDASDCGCSAGGCEGSDEAWEAVDDFVPFAQDSANFYPTDSECSGEYSFVIAKPDYQVAFSSQEFEEETGGQTGGIPSTLLAKISQIVSSLDLLTILYTSLVEDEETSLWGFEVSLGKLLVFRNKKAFSTKEAAEQALAVVLEKAKEIDNYVPREIIRTEACSDSEEETITHFSYDLAEECGEVIAVGTIEFDTEEERETAVFDYSLDFCHYLLLKLEGLGEYFWFSLYDVGDETLLRSFADFSSEDEALIDFWASLALLGNSESYQIYKNENGAWAFQVVDKSKVLASSATFSSKEERDAKMEGILKMVNCEGVHLVEHILLRPSSTADTLLPIHIDKTCYEEALQEEESTMGDPYSFWVSVVIPYWTERFRQMEFRKFFEDTLRKEAPAHVALKICWVDPRQMCNFESAYQEWKLEKAFNEQSCALSSVQNRLIDILTSLKNHFPSRSLIGGCGEENGDIDDADQYLVLGQSILKD
ncbi:hypothetical protein R9C00_03390 [Flammeovirgaceae bacterium SG7u.111]|nr:hypothetical protein [Flammeovirgaceae bacterium SG7u.132]WPO36487.1 hypothetical protein R9C00_03390 [Flammeovirgaceae bacterium SG7u.111]